METATAAPPGPAFLVKDTVQVLVVFAAKVAGTQTMPEIRTGASRPTSVWIETPPYVAVRVAIWSVRIVAVLMGKVAKLVAAGIVTDNGTLRAVVLLAMVMEIPAMGAALVNITAQEPDELGDRFAGLQESEDTTVAAPKLITAFAEVVPVVAVRVAF